MISRLPVGRRPLEDQTMNIGSKGNGLLAQITHGFVARLESWGLLRRFVHVTDAPSRERDRRPEPGDERAIRHAAEMQNGGLSSAESAARYARGENPGGIHHRAVHRDEGPLHMRPEYDPGSDYDEPRGHKERVPHGENHLPEMRKG